MRSRVHNAPATRNGVCRRGKHVNLFAGLLVDARDGGSYTYQHVGKRSTLVPVGAKQGHATKWASFTSSPFENAILRQLREVPATDISGFSLRGC